MKYLLALLLAAPAAAQLAPQLVVRQMNVDTVDADLSPDGRRLARLVQKYGGGTTLVQIWDLASNSALPTVIKAVPYDRVRWINNDRYAVSRRDGALPTLIVDAASNGGPRGQVAIICGKSDPIPADCNADKRPALTLPAGMINAGLAAGKALFWTASNDGMVLFRDVQTKALRLTFYSFPNNQFLAVLPDGRYDTNLAPDTDAVRWVVRDMPGEQLPASTFMRQYYTPLLVAKRFGCAAAGCDATFPPLPDLAGINRLLPAVRVMGLQQHGTAAAVLVEVTPSRDPATGKTSGVYDLHLSLNGRLVAQLPGNNAMGKTETLADWRRATALPRLHDGANLVTLSVQLPSESSTVSLSSYAFNSDRVKGPTSRFDVPISVLPPQPRRAVILTIGVDATANPNWRLTYAANDATALAAALGPALKPGPPGVKSPACDTAECYVEPRLASYDRIDSITLTSTAARNLATRATIHDVLQALGGRADRATVARTAAAIGVSPVALAMISPDDLLVIGFSGHGDTIAGQFYIVPADARADATGTPIPASLISAADLTAWLRPINPADTVMIIDACRSAASVDAGSFRPGPLGDAGLGQLAYDKGIRILAAAQADNVALEDGTLRHGLLTYALVHDGLAGATADINGDGELRLDEWLRYAATRVPFLAAELASGQRHFVRDLEDENAAAQKPRIVQRPALFDFTGSHGPALRPAG